MNSSFFPGLVGLGLFMLFRRFRTQQVNNDADSSDVPLPSPPSSSSRNWKYSVFPSFHGADVRTTILSHIVASFKRKGIYPFIDNEIDRSKSIAPELIEAIRSSKIAIVLLSKNYASSSWCLDELAEIISCREVLGQIVMPIFYEVEPTHIRKQGGEFGKAFRKSCKGKTKEHIERWRKALEDVATIAGQDSRNWTNEAEMIESIATDVSNMLTNSTQPRDFDIYVGMRAHMERMESLLRLDSDEVRMIGIWGPPGIGKSTIARVVFNQHADRFQHGTIMVNIKEFYPKPCLDEHSVQLKLQNQMLSQLLGHKDINIPHLEVAQEWLKDKKVLLIIDEVDRLGQLEALAKEISWFGFGSRIIVTTENRSLLKGHGINHIYKVEFPSRDEAFQIFCMNAFRQKHPDDGFHELAREVSYLAGKLPLGLKVLGSALRGKSKQEWEMLLPRLRTSIDGDIESIIRFSYNDLLNEDKYLFLYIACFFNSEMTHKVEELLAKQLSSVRQGLYILAEKSLISIDEYGTIEMHTLIEQFGRETSRTESVFRRREKRELLVDERDISEVISDDTTDNNRYIAINLSNNERRETETEEELNVSASDKALERISDLQFVRVHNSLIPQSVLQSLIFHSPKIRSLIWENFENICLPSDLNTQFLVKVDLSSSKLQRLWEGKKELKNLKWMDLSSSYDLKELPDLSTATKLEELILRYCKRLVEVPDLSSAIKLRNLDLTECSSLVEVPNLSTHKLLTLSLRGCSSLVTFSASGTFNNLYRFFISECRSLVELPFSIGTAVNLQKLDLRGCVRLVKLPPSIGILINLKEMDLGCCLNLVEIPLSIGNLQKLQELRMYNCTALEAFPNNINLKSLDSLFLKDCTELKIFPEISTNIKVLNLTRTAINEIPLTIKLWPRLRKLHLNECNNLVSLPQFPGSLSYLDASDCKSLERLDCSFNNPEIELVFSNCLKLNQEAGDLIIHTSTRNATVPGTEVHP